MESSVPAGVELSVPLEPQPLSTIASKPVKYLYLFDRLPASCWYPIVALASLWWCQYDAQKLNGCMCGSQHTVTFKCVSYRRLDTWQQSAKIVTLNEDVAAPMFNRFGRQAWIVYRQCVRRSFATALEQALSPVPSRLRRSARKPGSVRQSAPGSRISAGMIFGIPGQAGMCNKAHSLAQAGE